MFGHRWIVFWFLVALSFVKSEINREKNEILCFKNPPKSCSCSAKLSFLQNPRYEYICSNGNDSENKALMQLKYFKDSFVVDCINVQTSESFPDLTEYVDATEISLRNCSVSNNRSLYDYTSKISKNIKRLHFDFTGKNDEENNFNSNYFEGLSSLESFSYDNFRFKQDFRFPLENVFEKLVDLKKLEINNLPTPIGIFDSLKQLQDLNILNSIQKMDSIEFGLFKNQRKLISLAISGTAHFYIERNVFANLTELQILRLFSNSFNFLPENMLEHNHKLNAFILSNNVRSIERLPRKLFANKWNLKHIELQKNSHKHLPEDLFTNSTYIKKILITENGLKALPKDIFKNQINLYFLDLRSNVFENLTDGLFDSLSSLEVLVLSYNKLSSLSK